MENVWDGNNYDHIKQRSVAAWTWCEIAVMVRWDCAEHCLWLPHGAGGVLPETSLSQAVQC